MFTMIFTILFFVTVLWGAIVGLIRGMEKATVRLITLLLAAVLTFVVAGPVADRIVQNIRLDGATLGETLLESMMGVEMLGRIIEAAPLMQEAILVAPTFVIAIPLLPLVFLVLKFISWILHLIIRKPLCKLFFGANGGKKPGLIKRVAGMGIGVVTGALIFAVLFASVFGLFSMLPDAEAAEQTMDAMVQQQMLTAEDADLVREIYAVTDCSLVKAHQTVGVSALGHKYLNSLSKIEADGQTTYLGDEFDSLMAVAQTAVEGGLVEALMNGEDQNALYAVLADTAFVNELMQNMFDSKLLRAAAPEVMAIALESVTQSMNLPISKEAIYTKMMDSVAQAVRQADIDYAGIAAYEQANGKTRTVTLTEEAYRAEIQKRNELEKKISSILNRSVAGDNKAFTDSVAAQLVQQIQTQAAVGGQEAIEQFAAVDVQNALGQMDAATLSAGQTDAAELLEQLQNVEKFETDIATAGDIANKITQCLQEALGDDAKTAETAQALANVVSGLVGVISNALDEQGNLDMGNLDFGQIGDVVTELQNSPLKDVGSALLDIVGSSDLGDNDMIKDVIDAVQDGYDAGEDIGGTIGTAGDLINIGQAMGGDPEENREELVNSFSSLIENLNEYTIELLPSIFTESTITSMGVPAEYAEATFDVVETLLTELMELKGAADYENEVDAILHLYDLATTGVENFTEEDIPELVRCAKNSDAIYNTIIGISASNPFGIEIPDEATRTEIADAIEEYYETNSDHSSRERALYQAVAALLGLDNEVNLGA